MFISPQYVYLAFFLTLFLSFFLPLSLSRRIFLLFYILIIISLFYSSTMIIYFHFRCASLRVLTTSYPSYYSFYKFSFHLSLLPSLGFLSILPSLHLIIYNLTIYATQVVGSTLFISVTTLRLRSDQISSFIFPSSHLT